MVKLYPYCPALVRIRYQPHRGERQELVEKTLELIKANQMVVITGSDKVNFGKNCHLGKTKLALEVRKRILAREQNVLWVNLQTEMGYGARPPYWADRFKEFDIFKPSPAKVCFIDEAQHAFPYAFSKNLLEREDFNQRAVSFLDKLSGMSENGTHFILITSAHPFHERYRERMVSQEMLGFLTAPVVEVDSSTQFSPHSPSHLY